MNAVEKPETKDKILKAAETLFSELGFSGTSIREIAAKSDTNIASVNYHFKSKENLYWQVMDRSHMILENGIAEAASNVESIEELSALTFDFLVTHARQLKNALKMIMSEEVNEPPKDELPTCLCRPGPPGYQYFFPLIKNELPKGVNEVAIDWGVKSIFGSLMWWGMLVDSTKFKAMKEFDYMYSPEYFRTHIIWHTKSVMNYLKSHHRELGQELPPLPKALLDILKNN
jgi:AcrR family transcriptional regulator